MLKIFYGDFDSPNFIYNPDSFFNNIYEEEWITNPLSRQMIKDIDNSEVISANLIESPYLGAIPIERLSRGVKTLILMNFDSNHIFNASACGDNCASWILKIAQNKDLTIRLGYLMNFGDGAFDIEIANLGIVVNNMEELIEAVLDNRLI